MYQQADNLFTNHVDELKLNLLDNKIFVDKLKWRAVPWQLSNGVPTTDTIATAKYVVPDDMRHPAAGHHHLLNDYLVEYIKKNDILK